MVLSRTKDCARFVKTNNDSLKELDRLGCFICFYSVAFMLKYNIENGSTLGIFWDRNPASA